MFCRKKYFPGRGGAGLDDDKKEYKCVLLDFPCLQLLLLQCNCKVLCTLIK